MNASTVQQLIKAYLKRYPDEREALGQFLSHAAQADDTILTRHNFVGHITCAGFILAKDTERVLLLKHKSLGKWLQPGGHFEADDTDPLEAAKREILEETGLASELTYLPVDPAAPLLPFAIDVHYIPANPRKQEPEHYHYDFRYAFSLPHELEPTTDANESDAYRWFGLSDFRKQDHTFPAVAERLQALITT